MKAATEVPSKSAARSKSALSSGGDPGDKAAGAGKTIGSNHGKCVSKSDTSGQLMQRGTPPTARFRELRLRHGAGGMMIKINLLCDLFFFF